jgi:hypothetical protein
LPASPIISRVTSSVASGKLSAARIRQRDESRKNHRCSQSGKLQRTIYTSANRPTHRSQFVRRHRILYDTPSLTHKAHCSNALRPCLCGVALFELLRAPYRPPYDMTTFLGTEKLGVITFMTLLAMVGFGFLFSWSRSSTWTRRDITVLSVLTTTLIVAGSVMVLAPKWPVTQLDLILR